MLIIKVPWIENRNRMSLTQKFWAFFFCKDHRVGIVGDNLWFECVDCGINDVDDSLVVDYDKRRMLEHVLNEKEYSIRNKERQQLLARIK